LLPFDLFPFPNHYLHYLFIAFLLQNDKVNLQSQFTIKFSSFLKNCFV
jgi:hypothetical protein